MRMRYSPLRMAVKYTLFLTKHKSESLLCEHSLNALHQRSSSTFSATDHSTGVITYTPQQDEPLQQQQQQLQHPHAAKPKPKLQWKGTVWTPAAPAAVTEPLQEQTLLPAEPDEPLLSDSAHTTGTTTAAGVGGGIGQHRGYDTHSGRQGYDTHDTPYSEHSHHSEQRSARGSSFGNRSEAHDEGNGRVQLLAL
jgi:hypothetical protein